MVVVTAKIFFNPGKLKEAENILKELIEKTNQENGCIEYKSYLSSKSSDEIVIIEKWESQAHLDAHMKTKHFTELLPKIGEMCSKETEISVYSPLI